MKTLIAVPCMDQVPALFAQSLASLNRVDECAVAFEIGSLVYTSRNNLAKKAIEYGADFIFWLDSDMVFNPDLLELLHKELKEKDLNFLSGLYYRRVEPYTPVAFETLTMEEDGCKWTEFEETPTETFEVAGVGFGCVLMKTEMFIDIFVKFGAFFDPLKGVGEDLSFCWRARECGYKLYCNPTIPLGHVGNNIITKNYYDSYKAVRARNS